MFRSILVPLDGSAFAEHALSLAAGLARKSSAQLTIAHVHRPFLGTSFGPAPYSNPMLDDELRAGERAYLERVQARLAGTPALRVATELVTAPVVDGLAKCIAAAGIDLVVMTTHGRGGLARLWLGSVADGLIRHTSAPVLLVRPHPGPTDGGSHPLFKQIVVPVDGSPLAEQILPAALAVGADPPAEYILLASVEPGQTLDPVSLRHEPDPYRKATQEQVERAHLYLDGLAGRLRAEGRAVRTIVAIDDQPARAILAEADRHTDVMVALSTHGRGGVQRLRLGSVADKVVRGAICPVLVLRPGEQSAG